MYPSFSDELYHYGVLGMKWGVRKARSTSVTPKKTKNAKKDDVWDKYKRTQERRKKVYLTARKAVKTAYKIRLASFADDVFLQGAGKKVAKTALSKIGNLAVNSFAAKTGTGSPASLENVIKNLHYDSKTNSWR